MERAGIDIVTDGEMRRESYSNRFATALDGIDNETPGEIVNQVGQKTAVPRVVGKIKPDRPVELRDMQFCAPTPTSWLRSPCPACSPWASRSRTKFYKDAEAMCMDYAAAVNEAHDLVKAVPT